MSAVPPTSMKICKIIMLRIAILHGMFAPCNFWKQMSLSRYEIRAPSVIRNDKHGAPLTDGQTIYHWCLLKGLNLKTKGCKPGSLANLMIKAIRRARFREIWLKTFAVWRSLTHSVFHCCSIARFMADVLCKQNTIRLGLDLEHQTVSLTR